MTRLVGAALSDVIRKDVQLKRGKDEFRSPAQHRRDREEIRSDIRRFLQRGGVILIVPVGVTIAVETISRYDVFEVSRQTDYHAAKRESW